MSIADLYSGPENILNLGSEKMWLKVNTPRCFNSLTVTELADNRLFLSLAGRW
jgi:hypothetical protein